MANRTVVVQFRLKAMPVPTVHISSANASHEGLEGEPTTFGDQLTVTALLNLPVSADPARLECSSWQHSLPHVMFAP